MMHHMRPVNRIDRRHPVIQSKREILVKQIGRFIRAVDGVEGEGGRADGDVQVFAHADGQRAGAVARIGGRAVGDGGVFFDEGEIYWGRGRGLLLILVVVGPGGVWS